MDLCCNFFGWRKASTCKQVIEQLQCRLRFCIESLEQLSENKNEMDFYKQIDKFCEIILKELPNIQQGRDCTTGIKIAAASLIYASGRCNMPELRKLIGDRFGKRFVTAAVELLPGNLVHPPLIQNKPRLMTDIIREMYRLGMDTDHQRPIETSDSYIFRIDESLYSTKASVVEVSLENDEVFIKGLDTHRHLLHCEVFKLPKCVNVDSVIAASVEGGLIVSVKIVSQPTVVSKDVPVIKL